MRLLGGTGDEAAGRRRQLLQSTGGSAQGLFVQVYQNVQLKNVSLPAGSKQTFTTSVQNLNYSDIADSGLMTLAGQVNNFTLRFTGAAIAVSGMHRGHASIQWKSCCDTAAGFVGKTVQEALSLTLLLVRERDCTLRGCYRRVYYDIGAVCAELHLLSGERRCRRDVHRWRARVP